MINLSLTNEQLTYDEAIALTKALDYLINNPQRGLNADSNRAYQKLKAEIKSYEQSKLVVEEL